jgi:hypothetical protein
MVVFQCGGVGLALFPRNELAADVGRPLGAAGGAGDAGTSGNPPAVTLSQNYVTPADVDAAYASALASGAESVKAPEVAFWGGYSGYVADPDGHLWELAHNPGWPVADDGSITVKGA